ncbi:nucleoside 2-deoxyribosyltransferase [Marinobacter mobilis]|uniref:Nucleoside 2-deoxyribosyltransferase n=1 Tax=Marinobacter mobilis TaxID=488533 RepID=A0A1H2ZBS4_9GAMM|nr:nucleoside 2-deoxyribosyltransferase [Marinobacter mobilis]SDX14840.1 Nucleoside 2-deoxyribosyltransferase [Marinobacter mobilis]
MTTPKRIYLAGPEVFFAEPEHHAIVAAKKRILAACGLEGVDPLDTALTLPEDEPDREHGFRIFRANRSLMDSCDGVIANLTPFRGLSADAGTVYEVGYMIGQGKAAFGYSLDHRSYYQRAGGCAKDEQGHAVEPFGLADNLMIECGIEEAGGRVFIAPGSGGPEWFDEGLFRQCAESLAKALFLIAD